MLTPTSKIKHAFNRAAQTYDQHCQLQKKVADALLALLNSQATLPKNIIDIGCGTGINTEQLVNLYPHSDVYALDFADKLLQSAKSRLTGKNVQFIESDFDSWEGRQGGFDVIYSNLALHWSVDLPSTLNKLISLLNPNGVLVFSIPLVGTLVELSEKLLVRGFYSNEEIGNLISKFNFLSNTDIITLHYPDSFSALKSIKAVGASFVKPSTKHGLHGKAFLNNLQLRELTYVIGYFIVKKN